MLYFSVFLLRYRVIHYTRTGLYKYPLLAAVRVCCLKESTAYHYCQLHIAVEVQKAYTPAIYVASVGLQLPNKLHSSYFRSAAERSCRKNDRNHLKRRYISPFIAIHIRYYVHNMLVAQYVHHIFNANRPFFGKFTYIIPCQIH